MTSPYHQGPSFPVSSSPILPLDVQPSRTKRPSPLSLLALSDYPHRFPESSGVVSNGSHSNGLPPDSSRVVPSEWTDDTAACVSASGLGSQYVESTTSSTRMLSNTSYPPSRPLASTPAGWDSDLPMNLVPYAPLAQGSEGGTTFFYRSPTPSARQRTNQACEKCRDRKTKCSGGRPTCVRCQARGVVCEYAIEHRVRGPAKARKRNVPSADPPIASPTRTSFVHHPYAPSAHLGNSRWNLQPIPPKAQESIKALKPGWSLSDQSDESSDSSGAASFELLDKTPSHLRFPNGQGVEFTPHQPLKTFNSPDHSNNRFHTMHRSAVDMMDQFIVPTLQPSPSFPQLKSLPFQSLPFQNGSSQSTPGTYLATPCPKHTILNRHLTELPHGSLQSSRCPSSSSSTCASHSNSSVDDARNTLSNGMSSNTTLTPENWPSATDGVRERRYPWKADNSFKFPVVASTAETEGEIPKSSSQTFNVSDWITGTDYCSSPERTADAVDTVTPES